MHNALIYSPRFDGHRQVYVLVIANVLKQVGYNVVVAGNLNQHLNNSSYLDKVKEMGEVKFIDTCKYTNGGYDILIEEFLKLQNQYKIDLTVFPEAEFHLPLFNSQVLKKKRKFRGRTIGIFIRPVYYYTKIKMIDKMRFLKHFQSRWRKDERFFYEFITKHLSVLDVSLTIDENFVSQHKHFTWLPDVFQQYAEFMVPDHKDEQRRWIGKLQDFTSKNDGKFPFFYFGTAQYRRGYDILLKMALENEGYFIHCGLRDENEKFSYDTNQIRMALQKNGKLFETNEYIVDSISIKYFFESVSHLILPYRQYYGSSGVMLQALYYGIPVLSSDNGIIGHRINKHHLGFTYSESIDSDLKIQFERFKRLDPKLFENDIKNYMSFQTIDQLRATLINSFTDAHLPIKMPHFYQS